MNRHSIPLLAALLVLMSGCASNILRSEVTAFHEWPANLPDRSYVFERTKAQDQSLEYRNYEGLLRNEVQRFGLTEAAPGVTPALKITFDYRLNVTDVRSIEPVYADPFFYGNGFYGNGFYGRGYYGLGYDPYFWGPPLVEYQDRTFQVNRRQLHVLISRHADGRSLYDVTVKSAGRNPSLAAVMPYLMHSAFVDFPGRSGVPHTVDLNLPN